MLEGGGNIKEKYSCILTGNFEILDDIHIECDEGWVFILWSLCEELTEMNIPELKILQIKEKYGKLRVYPNIYCDEVANLIDTYEGVSEGICELCGKAGKLVGKHHFKTLCEEHSKNWIK